MSTPETIMHAAGCAWPRTKLRAECAEARLATASRAVDASLPLCVVHPEVAYSGQLQAGCSTALRSRLHRFAVPIVPIAPTGPTAAVAAAQPANLGERENEAVGRNASDFNALRAWSPASAPTRAQLPQPQCLRGRGTRPGCPGGRSRS